MMLSIQNIFVILYHQQRIVIYNKWTYKITAAVVFMPLLIGLCNYTDRMQVPYR